MVKKPYRIVIIKKVDPAAVMKGLPFYSGVNGERVFVALNTCISESKTIKKAYRRHFENGCSKSMACIKACPMKIETLSSIAKMNRCR